MAKKFTTEMSFKLHEEDSKLYHKYGVPAIELANKGDFLEAVKLIDKVLKENSKCEFALLLKANYLFNHVNHTLKFDEISPESTDKIRKQAEGIKEQLEECVNLIEKAIKINPKNKEAKGLKDFIEKNSLKAVNNLIKSAKDNKQKLIKSASGMDAKVICPYCKNDDVMIKVKKTEDEYNCPKCNKTFLAVIGEVRGARGLGGYVSHPVTIRLRNIEGGESLINYHSSYSGNDFRSGDLICAVYKKNWLSSSYGSKPTYIINWTTGLNSYEL